MAALLAPPAGSTLPGAVMSGAGNANLPANTDGSVAEFNRLPSVAEILAQPLVRRSLPGILALLVTGVFVLVFSWFQTGAVREVYPHMSDSDRQAAFTALQGADFSVSVNENSGQLMVGVEHYHQARMLLAAAGLPQDAGSNAMGSFSDDSALTTSQFMEQAKYTVAIENELAKSISQISTIKSARVHLAAPRQSAFVRNRVPAKASVVLNPHGGRSVSANQVQAITHMVASSIPYLSAEDVVVVDQRGNLLTRSNTPGVQAASVQSDYELSVEEQYRSRIDALLTPIVGRENVRTEVDVEIDFTEHNTTFEEYDTNDTGPKARSESISIERGQASAMAGGVPGSTTNVLAKQVGTNAGETETETVTNSQTTRNYEIDKTVRYVKRTGGSVIKMSVAIVINEAALLSSSAVGEADDLPMAVDQAQLESLTILVKSAVSFDEARGDSVVLLTQKFEVIKDIADTSVWYESPSLIGLVKLFASFIAFIFVLLIVIKPVLSMLLGGAGAGAGGGAGGLLEAGLGGDNDLDIEMGEGDTLEDIKARLKPKKSTISADMLDTANTYDDKVALIRMLVAEDSGRVANVLKKLIKPI
jgi:flagellar M-ring protein FliF